MKNQALFSSKGESKELKCCLLQFLLGPLRVNMQLYKYNVKTSVGWLFVTSWCFLFFKVPT